MPGRRLIGTAVVAYLVSAVPTGAAEDTGPDEAADIRKAEGHGARAPWPSSSPLQGRRCHPCWWRRAQRLIKPSPPIIGTQVSGSGTAGAGGRLTTAETKPLLLKESVSR